MIRQPDDHRRSAALRAAPAGAAQRFVVAISLGEQQPLDAVDVLDPLDDQHLALPADAPAVFVLGSRRLDHGADPRLAPLVRQQRANQRLAIDPVGLRPPAPARCRDRGRIDDMAFDAFRLQRPVDPETVEPSLLDDDYGKTSPVRARAFSLSRAKRSSSPATSPPRTEMLRHLLSAARRQRCDQPGRSTEFQRNENRAKISADSGRSFGLVSCNLHGRLQSGW